jgi:ComF family protein
MRVRFLPDDTPAYAPWAYTDAVRAALHRFKFEAQPELARRAARAMLECLPSELTQPAYWVPVPLPVSRLLDRGYNQAALLARELAVATCSPAPRHWLTRDENSAQQSKLDRERRFQNAEASFHVVQTRPRASRFPLIVVDDVVTTGATATACCSRLRAAGLNPIAVVSLAHA